MSSNLTMYGVTNESAQTTLDNMRLSSVSIANAFRNLSNYFMRVAQGSADLNWTVLTGSVQSQATLTVSAGGSSNAETMSLANVTLTAETSGADPTMGQFNISATAATQAASMVLAINSTPALAGIVTASNVSGVITLTAVVPGVVGNGIQLSEALTNVAITHAFGSVVVGSNGTAVTIAKGI